MNKSQQPKRIFVSSGPRNISTALMYSFAQRSDTVVVDEPLYGHYLHTTDADTYHPGAAETLATRENDWQKVVDDILTDAPLSENSNKSVIFYKNITNHLRNMEWDFLGSVTNVILTRDPREMLPSFAKNVPTMTLRDTGYPEHLELLTFARERGQEPPVLDGREVLKNPGVVLAKLCEQIGIPFDEAMLSWPAGARPEDGTWAPYWYSSVHQSNGFQPYRPKNEPFPAYLEPLLDECLPLYEEITKLAIRAR
ncbi:MAG: sulfotransferase family protein [Chloroflexota bacterium]